MQYNSLFTPHNAASVHPPIKKETWAPFRRELEEELENIASFWQKNTMDALHGGFIGKMDNHGIVYVKAPKYAYLNAGILWSLSAAYSRLPKSEFRNGADRAYAYIERHFIDYEQGGVFQSVDYLGCPLDKQKSVFALASTIIGLCEYYAVTFTPKAKELAVRLYQDLTTYSYDEKNGGYFDTFEDKAKGADYKAHQEHEVKSTKNHIRVLKSLVELYKIWPDASLKERIHQLVSIFIEKILNPRTWSLYLYFNAFWRRCSKISCFGYNMAAAWLLREAASVIQDYSLLYKTEQISDKIIEKAYIARDDDGGWWHEAFYPSEILNKEKHGWTQVHAIIALLQMGQRKDQYTYMEDALKSWRFVKEKICDKKGGEWFYGLYENGHVMKNEDKVGSEKCPFYNSFLCVYLLRSLPSQPTSMD